MREIDPKVSFTTVEQMITELVTQKSDLNVRVYCRWCGGWATPDVEKKCCARCGEFSYEAEALCLGFETATAKEVIDAGATTNCSPDRT